MRPKKVVIVRETGDHALRRLERVLLVEGSVETDISAFCQGFELTIHAYEGNSITLRLPPNVGFEIREEPPLAP